MLDKEDSAEEEQDSAGGELCSSGDDEWGEAEAGSTSEVERVGGS